MRMSLFIVFWLGLFTVACGAPMVIHQMMKPSNEISNDVSFRREMNIITDEYAMRNEREEYQGEEGRRMWRNERNDAVIQCYRKYGKEVPVWLTNAEK